MTDEDIRAAARAKFPGLKVELQQTQDGWQVFVGDQRDHCYEACQLFNGEIHLEQRD